MSRQNCRGDAVRAAHFLSKRMYPGVPAVDRWVLHIREYPRHMASIALFPAVVSGSTANTDVPLGVWYSFPVRRRIPFRYHWQTNIAGFSRRGLFPFRAAYVQWQISMCMDQVVETECTKEMLQIPMRRLMRIKSRSWVAIPKMHPKSTQKKPIALMATSFVKNGFGIRFLPLTCMKCDLFIQVQISNSLQHWILGMVNLDIIHKCLVTCLRFCV